MLEKIAFVFPGQGSQVVGMLGALSAEYAIIEETFAQASQVLGYDLWQRVQEGPAAELNKTEVAQPALVAGAISLWRIYQQHRGLEPILLAGHSLGEYSALVCAQAITYEEAIKLVAKRGQLMQQAVPEGEGAMAAVIGLADEQVSALCEQLAMTEVLTPANFNSPGQVVVAGQKSAVERLAAAAKEEGARMVKILPVSIPSHCPLMEKIADEFAAALAEVSISTPQIPVIHNVDVRSHQEPAAIRQALLKQLHQPVRWTETVQLMLEKGIQGIYECGPGKVLTGLNKRICDPQPARLLALESNLAQCLVETH